MYYLRSHDDIGKNIIDDIIKNSNDKKYLTEKYEFIEKCNVVKPIITIIKNWNNATNQNITNMYHLTSIDEFLQHKRCSEVCIVPFYKKIQYKNYNDTLLLKTDLIFTYFLKYHELNIQKGGITNKNNSYKKKYVKYKNKYLESKK